MHRLIRSTAKPIRGKTSTPGGFCGCPGPTAAHSRRQSHGCCGCPDVENFGGRDAGLTSSHVLVAASALLAVFMRRRNLFDTSILHLFLTGTKISTDEARNVELTQSARQKTTLVPSERLQWVLDEIAPGRFSVGQASLAQLNDEFLPGIVFIDNRWAYLSYKDEKYEITFDGREVLSIAHRSEFPAGVILWAQAKEFVSDNNVDAGNISAFGLITRAAMRRPRWLVDIAVATLLINLLAIVTSLFAMQVYDRVVPSLALGTLYTLSVGIIIIYTVDFVLKISRSHLLDKKSSSIDKEISGEIYQHLIDIQADKIPQQVGTLTAQMTSIESARQFFSSSVIFVLVDFPFSLLFIAAIYTIAGPVFFVYLIFFLISILLGVIAQRRSRSLVAKITARSNERLGILVDSIKGLESIKTSGAGKQFRSEWDDLNDNIAASSLVQKAVSSNTSTFASFLSQLAYVFAIIVGVFEISNGHMTMGGMIAASILGGRVLGPVVQAVSYLVQFENTRQSLQMIDGFLKIPTERPYSSNLGAPLGRPSKIELTDVSFTYPGSKVQKLDIPELAFNSGERVALLGAIGSGKSTLLKVVAGLYKPTSGLVKMNGVDVWQIDPFYINNNISYLSQSPELFKGTLRSNVALGRNITENGLVAAIQAVGLNSVIDEADLGINLPISEGGGGLSGGQKQLVALARMFVGNSAVWLMDEPTSALDPKSQDRVKAALLERFTDSDIFIFSTHNPKLAVELSTRVIVMERGRIINDVPSSKIELRQKNA